MLLLLPVTGLAVFALCLPTLVLVGPGTALLAVRSRPVRVVTRRAGITGRSAPLGDVSGGTLLTPCTSPGRELTVITGLTLAPARLRPLARRARLA